MAAAPTVVRPGVNLLGVVPEGGCDKHLGALLARLVDGCACGVHARVGAQVHGRPLVGRAVDVDLLQVEDGYLRSRVIVQIIDHTATQHHVHVACTACAVLVYNGGVNLRAEEARSMCVGDRVARAGRLKRIAQ